MTFRKRILIYLLMVFFLFTIAILLYQLHKEKNYRTLRIENTLDNYAELSQRFIENNHLNEKNDFSPIDSLMRILPNKNIRVTIINVNGKVLYDSSVKDINSLENHLERPEIQKALYSEKGSNIRQSSSTHEKYYYYARFYNSYFVRVAALYDIQLQNFLKGEWQFVFFMGVLFFVVWLLVNFLTKKIASTITNLKDFSLKAGKNEIIVPVPQFPENELGIISRQIVNIYNSLKKAKDDIEIEKEKLFNHLNVLNEGIAFFSESKEKILANSHFILFINVISEKSTISAQDIFNIPDFVPVVNFIKQHESTDFQVLQGGIPPLEYSISKSEQYFKVQCIIFNDRSFEILITDITRPEKRRLLKQQLTSNIAHELKTPLASIQGYLETLINNVEIDKQKQLYFLERAHAQSTRLALLLNDISLLNNIEDAGELFEFTQVKIKTVITDVVENLTNRLMKNNIECNIQVDENISINGNESLISSIFQNLIENVINYAGKDISIRINNYLEDSRYHYFSFSDSGKGIPEEHFPRIFERFYRLDQGRTRDTGGTGLGLSIVKHAVILHKGNISARKGADGGLEIIFSLAK